MIACLIVPYFAAAVARRDDNALQQRPLVIGGEPWEPRPLYAYSDEVARGGVGPGMSLRQAHLLLPRSHFLPSTPLHYQCLAGEILDLLTDITPGVEPDSQWHAPDRSPQPFAQVNHNLPARYYLDLETLPLNEAVPLLQEIGRDVRRETALPPAIGVAAQKLAAQIAAAVTRPNHLRPVTATATGAFLAQQPLSFLPLEREATRRLRLLGIRTLGQLAALPPATVQAQWGAEVAQMQQLIRGESPSRVRAPQPAPTVEAALLLDEPVASGERISAMLTHLAEQVAARLATAQMACAALRVQWEDERGVVTEQQQALRRPTAEARALATVLEELRRARSWRSAVAAVTVTATALTPQRAYQLSLFERPDAGAQEVALRGVMLKHGADIFYRAAAAERQHPLPQQRFDLHAWSLLAPDHDLAVA